jgi:Glyoxalase-like domain
MSPGTLTTALVLACGAAAQVSPQPLIGKGWGLDHVQITQPSDAEARETYATRLGFSVPPSSRSPEMGLEGTSISLPPSYLEIGLIYDRERASAYFREMTPGLARQAGMANYAAVLSRLQNKEGFIRGYFIDVAPVEDAAAFLRLVGKKVTLPPPPTYLVDGKQQPGGWQDLFIEEEPLHRGPRRVQQNAMAAVERERMRNRA